MSNSMKNRYGVYGYFNIFDDLKQKALETKGRAFSYSFQVRSEKRKYEKKVNSFCARWKEISSDSTNDYALYREDVLQLQKKGYRGVSCYESSRMLVDGRSHAYYAAKQVECIVGYEVMVSVDDSASKQIYEETLIAANEFKEYLLSQRSWTLSKIFSVIKSMGSWNIHASGIYSMKPPNTFENDPDYTSRPVVIFGGNGLGLKDLSGVEQCYGLGLALMEYAQNDPEWLKEYVFCADSIGFHRFTYDYVISILASHIKTEKKLQEW